MDGSFLDFEAVYNYEFRVYTTLDSVIHQIDISDIISVEYYLSNYSWSFLASLVDYIYSLSSRFNMELSYSSFLSMVGLFFLCVVPY